MQTIYADVLIITNFIISSAFLAMTAKLTHSSVKAHRLVIAGFIGGFSSLLILIHGSGALLSVLTTTLKLLAVAAEIAVCFSTVRPIRIIKLGVIYFVINTVFAGLCAALWNLFDGKVVYVKNYSVYFDVSLGLLIAVTIIAYVLITLWELLCRYCFDKNKMYSVSIVLGGKSFTLPGHADTGNSLSDEYYGKPVAVFYSDSIFTYMNPEDETALLSNKLHIISCTTISGEGLVYATRPVEISITDGNRIKKASVCAGLVRSYTNSEKCVFDPRILL